MDYKFKAWDKPNRRIQYDFYIESDTGLVYERGYGFTRLKENLIPLQYIGSQYSQTKECPNPEEMCEGDYIRVSGYSYEEPEDDWEGIIVKGQFGWYIDGVDSCGNRQWYSLHEIGGSFTTIYEKLGNKYENPKLFDFETSL